MLACPECTAPCVLERRDNQKWNAVTCTNTECGLQGYHNDQLGFKTMKRRRKMRLDPASETTAPHDGESPEPRHDPGTFDL